jgi:hypothetical protein
MATIARKNNYTYQDDYDTSDSESRGDTNVTNTNKSSDDEDLIDIPNCMTPNTTRKRIYNQKTLVKP